jgi:ATP synthase protein I
MPLDSEQNNTKNSGGAVDKKRGASHQAGLAMELPFTLVAAVLVGGVLGYFLDRWLHTKPILMLVFGGLGFFAGVREVIRRVSASGNG